jgi:hypothetical protein
MLDMRMTDKMSEEKWYFARMITPPWQKRARLCASTP